jgi:hypothetical protein
MIISKDKKIYAKEMAFELIPQIPHSYCDAIPIPCAPILPAVI